MENKFLQFKCIAFVSVTYADGRGNYQKRVIVIDISVNVRDHENGSLDYLYGIKDVCTMI